MDAVCCRFIKSLLGHVQRVYEVSWSSDSRLLCSSSADSTVKVWNVAARKLLYDLPGHSDEVFHLWLIVLLEASELCVWQRMLQVLLHVNGVRVKHC